MFRCLIVLLVIGSIAYLLLSPMASAKPQENAPPQKQAILWTSGDPEVAHRMVLMYLSASQQNQWFDEHMLIVWGPSSRLLAADKDLQEKVKQLLADGVDVKACVVCANSYGVADDLRELGIDVKGMGKPLADLQQAGWHVLTM